MSVETSNTFAWACLGIALILIAFQDGNPWRR